MDSNSVLTASDKRPAVSVNHIQNNYNKCETADVKTGIGLHGSILFQNRHIIAYWAFFVLRIGHVLQNGSIIT